MISTKATTSRKKSFYRIQVLNRQKQFRIIRNPVIDLCSSALLELGKACCALTVVFVSSRAMREMNVAYRGRDYPTDVLSFVYDGVADDGVTFLGDIVICPETAFRNAERWHLSPDSELRKLLLHGVLHLLGFDHEIDSGEMNRLQRRLLRRKFSVESPSLIASQLRE